MRIASATSLRAATRCFNENVEFWFAVLILSAAWFYYPYCQTGPTLCIWKKLLGISCPGCGLTRGVCFLVHGKWAEAIRFNPLSLLAVGILLSNTLYGVFEFFGNYRRRKGRGWTGQERSDSEAYPKRNGDWIVVVSEGL
jgi:hypothetical protein